MILVSAPSLAAAIEAGLATGRRSSPTAPNSCSRSARTPARAAYFVIPAGEVTEVAAIELPPSPVLTDNRLR